MSLIVEIVGPKGVGKSTALSTLNDTANQKVVSIQSQVGFVSKTRLYFYALFLAIKCRLNVLQTISLARRMVLVEAGILVVNKCELGQPIVILDGGPIRRFVDLEFFSRRELSAWADFTEKKFSEYMRQNRQVLVIDLLPVDAEARLERLERRETSEVKNSFKTRPLRQRIIAIIQAIKDRNHVGEAHTLKAKIHADIGQKFHDKIQYKELYVTADMSPTAVAQAISAVIEDWRGRLY
jgi:energy-coupling factor transporter ATP-binding protein EcfA2